MKFSRLNPKPLIRPHGLFATRKMAIGIMLVFAVATILPFDHLNFTFANQALALDASSAKVAVPTDRTQNTAKFGSGLKIGSGSSSNSATKDSAAASSAAKEASGKQSSNGSAKQRIKVSARYGCYYISREIIKKQAVVGYYPFSVSNAHGRVKFANISPSSAAQEVKVDSSTGRITIPKGFKMPFAKLKVRVTAKGDETYAAATKYVSMKVRSTTNRRALAQTAVNEWWRGMKNGTLNKGGKRYWSLWFSKRVPWCSEFAAWCCINSGFKPGIDFPKKATSAATFLEYYKRHPKQGAVRKVTPTANMQPGDLVIKFNDANLPSHTGIVARCSKGTLTLIEGNANGTDSVIKRTYNLKTYKKWRYYIRHAS